MKRYDDVVIGAGQSGPSLAVRLANAGRKVALVERRGLGGTCVNDGCIPTKTMIASARAAWMARDQAARLGVKVTGVEVDMRAVMARKNAVVQDSRVSLAGWIAGTPNLTLIEGQAAFEDPHRVRVGHDVLEAERFFVNVGGRAIVPDTLAGVDVLTNASMMRLEAAPEHLIVVGGSYVGLEFAQMFRRFGSRVTVIELGPRLIAREDADVSDEVRRVLELEGVVVHTGARVLGAEKRGAGVVVRTDGPEIEGSHVLSAIGRKPNTSDLGLDEAGVKTDARGFVVVDDQLVSSAKHIWAIGDVNGRGAFTHTSYNDYQIVAENLLDGGARSVKERLPIYGLFTDPPLGRVGMNEAEAKASGRKVLVGKRPMTRVGRAHERGETHGFIKVLVDADSKEILGAAILGVEGDEAVHVIASTMYARAPYTTLLNAVHAHPTVSELIPTTLESLKPL